jgi:hypothetical protein
MAKPPPVSLDELEEYKKSFADSTARYQRCKNGHVVDVARSSWTLTRNKRKWHIYAICGKPHDVAYYRPDGVSARTTSVPCTSGILYPISDDDSDPRLWRARQVPQHESTAWRDAAAALPEFGGIYGCVISSKTVPRLGSRVVPRYELENQCVALLFTTGGEIYEADFDSHSDGNGIFFNKDRTGMVFLVDAASPMAEFRRRAPGIWRGLYTVTGQEITCTVTAVVDEHYTYSGTLPANGAPLTLTKRNAKGRKIGKYSFKFYPFTS